MNELKFAWDKAQQRARDRSFKWGKVGKHNPDTTITYAVTGRTDRLWVTLADKTVVEARNEAGVPQTEDYPVRMEVRNRVHVIVGRDTRGTQAVPTPTPPSGVLPHPMADHTDVDIVTPTVGQAIVYNGTLWVNSSLIPEAIAATIEAAAAKTTPVGADNFGITDSEAAGVLKKLSWSNIVIGMIAEVGFYISGLAAKVTPIDADSVVITDSAASDAPKRTTLTNFKAFLKTYFDTLYELAGAIATHAALTVTHGATGAIVGTTNSQVLTNKTLTAPTIADFTNSAHDHLDADDGGALAGYVDLTTAQTVATGIKTFTPGIVTPTIDGGSAANADLTLQGTTSATRATSYVTVQPNGGFTLIGNASHLASLNTIMELIGDFGATAPMMAFDTRSAIAGSGGNYAGGGYTNGATTPARFGAIAFAKENATAGDATGQIYLLVNDGSGVNALAVGLTIAGSNGNVIMKGVGGGFAFVSVNNLSGTEIDLLPAGTVGKRARVTLGDVMGSAGTNITVSPVLTTPGAGSTSFVDGTFTITMRLYSTGRLTIQRTGAGPETFDVALNINYIS